MSTEMICGIDEVGTGTWAGPVYVSGVVLDPEITIDGLRDSKKLKPSQRECLYKEILEKALFVETAIIDASDIDRMNIANAVLRGMTSVASQIDVRAAKENMTVRYMIDGEKAPRSLLSRAETIIGGDNLIPAISAASIVAKVERDLHMQEMEKVYPGYGFGQHKGYGTKQHRLMLMEHGPCSIHRMSFRPMKDIF